MHQSVQATAQMTDFREHDVSGLVSLRASAVARADTLGFRLSYSALFARAAVMALLAVPELNSALTDGGELRRYERVDLGTAVAIPDGLLVPVVRGAEQLSLRALNEALAAVIERARTRTSPAEELAGGTFTVTNFGSFGSQVGTPILLPPQVGIMGVGALLDRPVVRDGQLAVGKVAWVSLTVDHRVIDGEAVGRFQNELARLFADPDLLLYG
jgi:pyruvate/2-oxoglutarate dehydrogenase complex dihydrolipoamide acyltransferase (E2) component